MRSNWKTERSKWKKVSVTTAEDAWDVTTGYLVSFGGLFGNRIHKGQEVVPVIKDEETLFRVTDAAIQFFDDNANPSERFQFTIERVGEDKFEKVIKEAYNG